MMTTAIMILIFCLGYLAITIEHKLDVNKSAPALLIGVVLWVFYILNAQEYVPLHHAEFFQRFMLGNPEYASLPLAEQIRHFVVERQILFHVGEIAEIILFLMGAMTIVEIIDQHGGFNFVKETLTTHNRRKLLWMVTAMTFFLSAILDNLTTAIVMIMVLRKILTDRQERLWYSSMVIIAANSGGAFSPIGDVTTIMLWIKGNVTTGGVITSLFIPSLVSVVVPTLLVSLRIKGYLPDRPQLITQTDVESKIISRSEKNIIFFMGVGSLLMVPIFHHFTGLPPFMGILLGLSILWGYTEIVYHRKKNIEESIKHRVTKVLNHIDMSTILFFFGILMAVAALEEAGVLRTVAAYFDEKLHNVYLLNIAIGILSSIVDNVPLVAGAMGMYSSKVIAQMPDLTYAANFVQDGIFWELLAYCAGVGGSLLIIGSAAGVIVMGLEKITFGWYLKRFTLIVLVGYLAGAATYYLQQLILS